MQQPCIDPDMCKGAFRVDSGCQVNSAVTPDNTLIIEAYLRVRTAQPEIFYADPGRTLKISGSDQYLSKSSGVTERPYARFRG
jgi:hypothetical protein